MKSNIYSKNKKASVQVLIVEDQREWRDHFFKILNSQGYGVAKASNLQEARFYLQRTQPNVVLLDMHLGSLPSQGWNLMEEIKPPPYGPQIIVVTGTVDTPKEIARLTNKRDFDGYEVFHFLPKIDSTPQFLKKIVKRAIEVGEDLIKGIPPLPINLKGIHEVNNILVKKQFKEVTEREHEVLERLILGDSNLEIAVALSLDIETIKTYVKNIHTKFLVDGRGRILPFAIKMGLIQ